MTDTRWRGLGIALLVAIAAAPINFLAGVYVMGALMIWKSGPVGGEALQGAAFAAFLFGGPLGVIVGAVVLGGIAAWFASRMSVPVVIGLLIVLAGASVFAMSELGTI